MNACWAFAGVTLGAVVMAAFVGDLRRAVLALWVAGLGVGAIYLTLGAEVLAVVQWIVSTLVAISFVFFSAMFGEYGPTPMGSKGLIKTALGVMVGAGFAATVWCGSEWLPEGPLGQVVDGTDIAAMGKAMTGPNLISLEVLALTLFLVLVGGGVIGRPDGEASEPGPEVVSGPRAEGETS